MWADQRFLLVSVQAGKDVATFQAGKQSIRFDERATRDVGEYRARVCLREFSHAQTVARAFCETTMQRDDIGGQHLTEGGRDRSAPADIVFKRMLGVNQDGGPR